MAAQEARRARLKVLLLVVIILAALAVALWFIQRRQREGMNLPSPVEPANPVQTTVASPTVSPIAVASPALSLSPTPSPTPPTNDVPVNVSSPATAAIANSYVGTLKLIIPVNGVRPDQLIDTFADARSEGRVHDAIDIPAAAGTPVLAAADGEIVKLFQSERGGITIYQLNVDKKLIFYYAHLQRYADGLTEGKVVKQGEVIAYVGDTGNAGTGNFHLHFSIAVAADPKRYWEGTNINPYPLLRGK